MLPTKTISLDDFITYTGFDRSECINTLEDIQEMGWIKNEQNGYYLHQILKEVLFSKIEPSFEEVKYLVEYFQWQMYVGDTDNTMDKVKYIDYGIAIFDVLLKKEDKDVQLLSLYFANQIGILNDSLGEVYINTRDYSKALQCYLQSLTVRVKVVGSEHQKSAKSYKNIGSVYYYMEDYSKALAYHQKSLAIKEKVLGLEHPSTAISYNNIGLVYDSMGDYSKALEYYQKSLAIREKVLGKEHPDTAQSYNNVAIVYFYTTDYSKAYEYMQKAVDIFQKMLPANHPNLTLVKKSLEFIKSKM